MLGEVESSGFAKTDVGAGDQNDLAIERGDVRRRVEAVEVCLGHDEFRFCISHDVDVWMICGWN